MRSNLAETPLRGATAAGSSRHCDRNGDRVPGSRRPRQRRQRVVPPQLGTARALRPRSGPHLYRPGASHCRGRGESGVAGTLARRTRHRANAMPGNPPRPWCHTSGPQSSNDSSTTATGPRPAHRLRRSPSGGATPDPYRGSAGFVAGADSTIQISASAHSTRIPSGGSNRMRTPPTTARRPEPRRVVPAHEREHPHLVVNLTRRSRPVHHRELRLDKPRRRCAGIVLGYAGILTRDHIQGSGEQGRARQGESAATAVAG